MKKRTYCDFYVNLSLVKSYVLLTLNPLALIFFSKTQFSYIKSGTSASSIQTYLFVYKVIKSMYSDNALAGGDGWDVSVWGCYRGCMGSNPGKFVYLRKFNNNDK